MMAARESAGDGMSSTAVVDAGIKCRTGAASMTAYAGAAAFLEPFVLV
jgi:hypothetical protein